MPHFKKLMAGQKLSGIPSESWNGAMDVARAYADGLLDPKRPGNSKVIVDAGIFPVANSTGSSIELFSVVGVAGQSYAGIDGLLGELLFDSASVNPERFAVLAESATASGGIAKAVLDGLTPCRIKLNRDPSVFHSRATPVAGETYLLADEIGYYDVLWHSDKQADDPETDAEQGDLVYAIVRLGRPVRDWVSVHFDYSSSLAEPDSVSTDFIYSGAIADTAYDTVSGSGIETPVWILFDGGVKDMTFWDSDLKLDGYFHGFLEHNDETRPLITVPENPIKKLFGQWNGSPADSGTVDIYLNRSTQLGTYSVTAGATQMGNVTADGAWVYVEYLPHETLGRAWEVTGEACPSA